MVVRPPNVLQQTLGFITVEDSEFWFGNLGGSNPVQHIFGQHVLFERLAHRPVQKCVVMFHCLSRQIFSN